jgi:hypothetical protein
MKLHHQLNNNLLVVIFAPFIENIPQYFSINRIVSFLQIDQQVELPLFVTMDFIEQPASVNRRRFSFFKSSLIDFRADKVWTL